MNRISFNTITNYRHDLPSVLELYQRFGITHATLWREKIDPVGSAQTRRLLEDHAIQPTCICGWYDRDKSSVTIDDKRRTIEIAAEINATAVTLLVPGLRGFEGSLEECRKQGLDHAASLLDHARDYGVKLALEPIHPKLVNSVSCLNTVAQAIDWCQTLGPGIGVELDVNNVWWDPDLENQIRRAAAIDLICGVQLCDVPGTASAERVVMGEGIVDLAGYIGLLEEVGYTGRYEIELIGPSLWERDTDDYMAQILNSCKRLLG